MEDHQDHAATDIANELGILLWLCMYVHFDHIQGLVVNQPL